MRIHLSSAISCSSLQNVKVEGSILYICHSIPMLTIPAMSVYLRPRQINLSKLDSPIFCWTMSISVWCMQLNKSRSILNSIDRFKLSSSSVFIKSSCNYLSICMATPKSKCSIIFRPPSLSGIFSWFRMLKTGSQWRERFALTLDRDPCTAPWDLKNKEEWSEHRDLICGFVVGRWMQG